MNIFSTIPLRAEIGARAASVYGEWRNFFKRWSRSPTNRTSRENNKCETRTVEEARTGTESPDVLSTPPSKRQRRAATSRRGRAPRSSLIGKIEIQNSWPLHDDGAGSEPVGLQYFPETTTMQRKKSIPTDLGDRPTYLSRQTSSI